MDADIVLADYKDVQIELHLRQDEDGTVLVQTCMKSEASSVFNWGVAVRRPRWLTKSLEQ